METQQPGMISVPEVDVGHYSTGIVNFFTNNSGNFWESAQNFVGVIVGISIPVAIFFMIAIVLTVEGIKRIRNLEDEKFNKPAPDAAKTAGDTEQAKRWRKVVEHAESNNPNDWRQAIIEADVMLEQLLNQLGYQGQTMGDKFKRISRGDFKTLDQAQEAHGVRNRIAHGGSAFDLNQLEAKQTIGLYRQVFDEFYHISEK